MNRLRVSISKVNPNSDMRSVIAPFVEPGKSIGSDLGLVGKFESSPANESSR